MCSSTFSRRERAAGLLDLFCGAGGAAMGYSRAGFEVVGGVDRAPQRHYPFEFVQADALTYPLDGFDVIHASPPCQAYSVARVTHPTHVHPKHVAPMRERLRATGRPYVIENVIGAPLEAPVLLCGTMFGLETQDVDGRRLFLRRHRLFESSEWLVAPTHCTCVNRKARGQFVGGVYGGGGEHRSTANRAGDRGGYSPPVVQRRALIDAPWMTLDELSQAIPPAYTEWLGAQLLRSLGLGGETVTAAALT